VRHDDAPPQPISESDYGSGEPSPKRSAVVAKRFALVPFNQIRMLGGATYLVKELIPRAGLIIVWGPPKCGKSFLTFDLMMHVAMGWQYRGRRVKQGVVVYCALEGAEGFRARVEAFRREKLSEDASPPFHLMASSLSLVADHPTFLADIRAQLGEERPAVVVIDTLNRSLAGSENDDKDMNAYVKAADALRDAFDCAVIIVHHCGHGGDRPRGHSLLMGALDIQIAVKRDAADNIVATLELSKDGAAGAEIVSRLVPVEVGVDDDGDPVTSCVIEALDVEPTRAPKPNSTPRLSKAAQTALRALQKTIDEVGETAPTSNHIPQGARTVTLDQWRGYAYRMGISTSREGTSPADEERAKRKAFQSATDALIAAGAIGIWEPHVWRSP
jgi:hypothetical protein